MKKFLYKAANSSGQMIQDTIEAATQSDAMTEIQKRGYTLLEIKQSTSINIVRKKVSKKELAMFTKQLSYLIGTGIALHRGVEIIGEQQKNVYFKEILTKIIQEIKEGIPLSQACAKHPAVFPESMLFQLKAAESGGFMQESLQNISGNFERDASFSSQVRGAMIYPSGIVFVTFIIIYAMLTFVVPKISSTLVGMNAKLPTITLVVVNASDFFKSFWYLIILGFGGLVYLIYYLFTDSRTKVYVDKILLKLPLIGNLIVMVNVARTTRVMASLLSSGVPIDDTLDNLVKVISNSVMSNELKKVKDEVVDQGISLSKSLELKPVFPRTMVQVVAVGEESGNLPEVLNNLAENLEEEVSSLLNTVTSLINPILMIVIGVVVAVIVGAMFMPMLTLMDQF